MRALIVEDDLTLAAQLAAAIRAVGREGLDPTDYDAAGLDRALRSGDPLAWSAAATERFNKLSSDLALGHVRGDARVGWHIVDKDLDATRQRSLLDRALATGSLAATLTGVRGPVLLVDDLVSSRWTLTVAGRELRRAGVDEVLPFALAVDG